MDHPNPKDKDRYEKKQPDPRLAERRPEKGEPHQGPLPEGNGATGKPASFPPHN